jgi:UDP-N-acetyl-D-galactosamine dehydrogenase
MNTPAFESFLERRHSIAVVGLGYVGLPLAVHLSAHFSVVGFDIKKGRIAELQQGYDRTLEIPGEVLKKAAIVFSAEAEALTSCRMIIIAVPTPIDDSRIPDLRLLKNAAAAVGRQLTAGSTVVFESTVYPGVTEDICVPILESIPWITSPRLSRPQTRQRWNSCHKYTAPSSRPASIKHPASRSRKPPK